MTIGDDMKRPAPMTEEELQAVYDLASDATQGPYYMGSVITMPHENRQGFCGLFGQPGVVISQGQGPIFWDAADCQLICESQPLILRLVGEIRRLKAANAELYEGRSNCEKSLHKARERTRETLREAQ